MKKIIKIIFDFLKSKDFWLYLIGGVIGSAITLILKKLLM